MSDVWSDRAELYVESDAHREGDDLDQMVAWAAGAGRRSTWRRAAVTSPGACVRRVSRS